MKRNIGFLNRRSGVRITPGPLASTHPDSPAGPFAGPFARRPIVIDLFCGLGGWTEGFLAEGYDCIGFDIERHDYGSGAYPGQLVLQDILTLHGSQFRHAVVIVASPPCHKYSYMAMPWSRAKKMVAEYRSGVRDVKQLNALFDACFRIQREACDAAGRHIPMIVENVRGAILWVGPARAEYGSFILWGDIGMAGGNLIAGNRKELLPMPRRGHSPIKGHGSTWFGIENNGDVYDQRIVNPVRGHMLKAAAAKSQGQNWSRFRETGETSPHYRLAAAGLLQSGSKGAVGGGQLVRNESQRSARRENGTKSPDPERGIRGWFGREGGAGVTVAEGHKGAGAGAGAGWFDSNWCQFGSRSNARKAASAQIAKIPFPLSSWIARCFKPVPSDVETCDA